LLVLLWLDTHVVVSSIENWRANEMTEFGPESTLVTSYQIG